MIRQRVAQILSFVEPAAYGQWARLVALGLVMGVLEVAAGGVLLGLLATLSSVPGKEVPLVGRLMGWAGSGGHPAFILAPLAIGLFVVKGGLAVQQVRLQSRCSDDAFVWLSRNLLARYFNAPYEFHMGRQSGELIKNINMAIDLIARSVLLGVAVILGEIFVVIGLLGLALAASPALTLIAVVVLGGLFAALTLLLRRRMRALGEENQDLSRQAQQLLVQSFEVLKEVSLYNLSGRLVESYARIRSRHAGVLRHYLVLQSLPNIIVEVVIISLVALGALSVVWMGQNAVHVLPLLGLFAYLALRLKPSAMKILAAVNTITFGLSAVDLIHKDLNETPQRRRSEGEGGAEIRLGREIAIEKLSYSYPGAQRQALDGVSLRIAKGDCIGIVGASGSGKTTFVDAFIGLLQADAGRILVDGRPIEPASEQWARFIGYVPQSISLIDGTLRDNIALGAAPGQIDEARIAEAVRLAQLGPLVAANPDGLDMMLGERGLGLSGGERQRVAIARALYRRPEILVFDEATAALDLKTEAEIGRAIRDLKGKLTMLIIAHRLTAVSACNRLLLFNGGRIEREGSYDEVTANIQLELERA